MESQNESPYIAPDAANNTEFALMPESLASQVDLAAITDGDELSAPVVDGSHTLDDIDPTTPTGNDPAAITIGDPDVSDLDSALGSPRSEVSSTILAPDELFNYPEIYGRTYHNFESDIIYVLPNDEREKARLDLQSHLFSLTLEKLYLAPVKDPQWVLDMCTGTGIWAVDFADNNPQAFVLGTDISPIQPEFNPPNLRYELHDMEQDWAFKFKFDFIHARMVFSCFKNPAKVIKSAFDFLDTDGFLELQDAIMPIKSDDGSLHGTHLERWIKLCMKFAKEKGADWTCASQYKNYLHDAGFVNIQEVHYKWPIGYWSTDEELKEIGTWSKMNLDEALEAISMNLLTSCGMTSQEVELLLLDVRKDMKRKDIHAYISIVVVYGQKP